TSLPPAAAGIAHPFPPYVIFNTAWQIVINSNNQGNQIGNLIASNADGLDQAGYEDCWFESAVGAVATTYRGQNIISRMITSAGADAYEVKFRDMPDQPIMVSGTEIANDKLKDKAYWAQVLEAAVLKRFPALRNGLSGNAAVTQQFGLQADLQVGLKLLTRKDPTIMRTSEMREQDLSRLLVENQRLQLATVAGTYSQAQMPDPKRILMVPQHAFAVLYFNRRTAEVVVRNPWGHNNAPKFPDLVKEGQTVDGIHDIGGGVIRMPLKTFKKYFRRIAWSTLVGA
ncbi:MAG TPA: hypothetical protein V6C69_16765, partial [Trichormus sp.]